MQRGGKGMIPNKYPCVLDLMGTEQNNQAMSMAVTVNRLLPCAQTPYIHLPRITRVLQGPFRIHTRMAKINGSHLPPYSDGCDGPGRKVGSLMCASSPGRFSGLPLKAK
jgi:hypothetical protein